ncbi:collagen-like protein [Atopomonas sediminilitoris]|uniref:collagen-like protein n=1 Tax=Atopomonas sediminilitoris TaxID=2919919 RepID=UPI001F4D8481|nr:collagen-like protein [Atopomonas sediminilitoris]MCJ8170115.1 collagen-like protein [Atopomonas sediminilitoris]
MLLARYRLLSTLGSAALLSGLLSPLAQADFPVYRLGQSEGRLQLDYLEVDAGERLVVPRGVKALDVGRLLLAEQARLKLPPGHQRFELTVQEAIVAPGSVIDASGRAGDVGQAGASARPLVLHLASIQGRGLIIDARGGEGGQGDAGIAGAHGYRGNCWFRSATNGADGGHGGQGGNGGNGAEVIIYLPDTAPDNTLQVQLQGGAGGEGGLPGAGGRGGKIKFCGVYGKPGGRAGRAGQAGQPGSDGAAGLLKLIKQVQPPRAAKAS